MKGRFCSYLRVSTARQGQSGLGLEAQRETVRSYLGGNGWELLKEFQEVESGKGSNALEKRPVLREALEFCRRKKATLIIAKQDRLARSVAFVSTLMESKVKFVVAESPHATPFEIHIRAAVDEENRRVISVNTKAALAAAKARGVKLGNPAIHALIAHRKQAARAFAEALRPAFEEMRVLELSQRKMVAHLNDLKIPTVTGTPWKLVKVQKILARLKVPAVPTMPTARLAPQVKRAAATGETPLARRRGALGLTQRNLAQLSGVSQAIVSRTENSLYTLKFANAQKLAGVLGCSAQELMG